MTILEAPSASSASVAVELGAPSASSASDVVLLGAPSASSASDVGLLGAPSASSASDVGSSATHVDTTMGTVPRPSWRSALPVFGSTLPVFGSALPVFGSALPVFGWTLPVAGKFLLLFLISAIIPAAEGRPGRVFFSDGTVWTGTISPASGARLEFHDGSRMRPLDPARLQELRFFSEQETTERAFSMPEAGRTVRVETGEPYPLRHLRVQVQLLGGEVLKGHLYATAMTVRVPPPADAPADAEPEKKKLVLPAKQRGQPGQRLDQLVFVQRIAFDSVPDSSTAAPNTGPTVTIAGGADELGAAALEGLVPLGISAQTTPKTTNNAHPAGSQTLEHSSIRAFIIDPTLGSPLLLAARRQDHLAVSWPAESDPALSQRLTDLLRDLNDFFDERNLLGVWAKPGTDEIFSLMLLRRIGATTDGPNKPWHLEVWRWRLDPGGRGLTSARVMLLRGVSRPGMPAPTVSLQPTWFTAAPPAGSLNLEGWAP